MSPAKKSSPRTPHIRTLRTFRRFTLLQRLEHILLILTVLILLLTGLPQKYRSTEWSQQILSTPEKVTTLQQIHHITAIFLGVEVAYHLLHAFYLMFRRRLSADMFPSLQDIRDAWRTLLHLLFIKKEKPSFGKYNFEQKVTYWFVFFGIGILGISGLILRYPEVVTRFLPGGVIPAAKLAHSNEALVLVIFILIWHFYHVHIERFNLSIFSGWLNAEEMREYHILEYRNMSGRHSNKQKSGENM
jgi:formate dehydrogenase subunit gamma